MPQRTKRHDPTLGNTPPAYTVPPVMPIVGATQTGTPVVVAHPDAHPDAHCDQTDADELARLIAAMPNRSELIHIDDFLWRYSTHILLNLVPRPRTFYAETAIDALRSAQSEKVALPTDDDCPF